jgi:hypothetical protein
MKPIGQMVSADGLDAVGRRLAARFGVDVSLQYALLGATWRCLLRAVLLGLIRAGGKQETATTDLATLLDFSFIKDDPDGVWSEQCHPSHLSKSLCHLISWWMLPVPVGSNTPYISGLVRIGRPVMTTYSRLHSTRRCYAW